MNILSNYARHLELAKYATVNEAVVFEADADPAKALEQVKSGKNGGGYANQWNQVQTAVVAGHEAGQTTGTVMVKHDNGSDMVNVTWKIADSKVELSVAGAASGTGAGIDINKIAEYNPNRKLNEFVAALVTVALEKYGRVWGKAHIDWITAQINKLNALQGSFAGIQNYIKSGTDSALLFLIGTGDVSSWITSLSGGDKDAVTGVIADASLKTAGSALPGEKLNKVLVAISGKLGESITSVSDEKSIVSLYQLITAGYGSGQLEKAWNALGKSGGLLSTIIDEIDNHTYSYSKSLMIWAIGVRGLTATGDAYIKKTGFDTASYTASVAAIKKALV